MRLNSLKTLGRQKKYSKEERFIYTQGGGGVKERWMGRGMYILGGREHYFQKCGVMMLPSMTQCFS